MTHPSVINVLVVDDEPLAREGVKLQLAKEADFNVIGECGNAVDAIKSIQNSKPDLVFLDIKMPGQTGFDVINAIGSENMPLVIFMTAYDQYAIDAFQINALDYLLKPINPALFKESLNRARNELKRDQFTQHTKQLNALLKGFDRTLNGEDVEPDVSKQQERIVVRSHGHVYFVRPQDILWIEAEGDYVNVHTKNRSHLLRDTMRNMEKRLANIGFQRIHRSLIVKVDIIVELTSLDSGDYDVIIENGTKLKLSRSYRDQLFERLTP